MFQRLLVGAFGASALLALCLGVARACRPHILFNFTEGMIAGSLAAFQSGGLAALYPADWSSAPLVLTLYPPGFFLTSGALASTLGTDAIFLAPRLVSLAATLAAGIVLVRLARHRNVSAAWSAVLLGAVSLHPGVYRQFGAAQTDMMALGWTLAGVWFVLSPPRNGRNVAALACFAMAAFAKQSFVAAPFALLVHRVRTGERRAVIRDYAIAVLLSIPVLIALQSATDGGFLRHVVGAVADSGSLASAVRVARDSRPELWLPLGALVGLAVRSRLRPEFPELWLATSVLLNGAATMKVGASVNYFLEPLAALVVVALVRAPSAPWEVASDGRRAAAHAPALRRIALVVLAVLGLGAAGSAYRVTGDLVSAVRSVDLRLAGFTGGTPLVIVDFFPAVMEQGGRPYLNDPFAFGALAASGAWDPSGLRGDLEAGRVPFVITDIDVLPETPSAAGIDDLLFGYFWRMPDVREPLIAGYGDSPTADGILHVWTPLPPDAR